MNRLSGEKSPYLQQHAHNPIDWFPWGKEAFDEAVSKNKLIFLSVGYSTCHWCHVMERESFENNEVAEMLNRSFVSIKVDREERPDVDAIYMDAIQAITGQGGWPMSVFLTPDLKPFFGGTYFPKDRFLWMLSQLQQQWTTDSTRIRESGDHLIDWMSRNELKAGAPVLTERLLGACYTHSGDEFDWTYGGRSGAPKFPPAAELRLLLRIFRRTAEGRALEMVTKTLDEMGRGGIYDAVAGGFHRYSTDEQWLAPHFEKMLYDQASMSQAYVEAFQVTGNREYELIAREILDYVLGEMTSPEGAFYSAEDADSEGVEGKFYVWTYEELVSILGGQAGEKGEAFIEFREAFSVTSAGNFEHGLNILTLQPEHSRTTRPERLRESLKRLHTVRAKRIRPLRDEKVITGWNGLMITAMARAGRAFGEPRYVQGAEKAAHFVLARAREKDGSLKRRWIGGEAAHPAFLDDYAFFIEGLLELYQSGFDPEWLRVASELQAIQDRLFLDPKPGTYFFAPDGDPTLIQRQKEFFDNVQPAGNSVAALNLLKFHALTLDAAYLARAHALLKGLPAEVEKFPWAFSQLLFAVDFSTDRFKEIAVVGDPASASFRESWSALQRVFSPNAVFAAGVAGVSEPALLRGKTAGSGGPRIYVCEAQACQAPTESVKEASRLLSEFKPYLLL